MMCQFGWLLFVGPLLAQTDKFHLQSLRLPFVVFSGACGMCDLLCSFTACCIGDLATVQLLIDRKAEVCFSSCMHACMHTWLCLTRVFYCACPFPLFVILATLIKSLSHKNLFCSHLTSLFSPVILILVSEAPDKVPLCICC